MVRRAHNRWLPSGRLSGRRLTLFQGHRKRKTLAQEVLDLGNEGKTLQCERLRVRNLRFVFHESWFSAPKSSREENAFVGSLPPARWLLTTTNLNRFAGRYVAGRNQA